MGQSGLISDNGISRVWRENGWVYKSQPKFLTDNEIWCLKAMEASGYVPYAKQIDRDTIRMQDLGQRQPVQNARVFMQHMPLILGALANAGIRHGDLTKYALIVRADSPYIIDFAESRLTCDPRPDKRREGDKHWLTKTMRSLCP